MKTTFSNRVFLGEKVFTTIKNMHQKCTVVEINEDEILLQYIKDNTLEEVVKNIKELFIIKD